MYALTSYLLELTAQDFALGHVAIAWINITHLMDALSKAQLIDEAETSVQ